MKALVPWVLLACAAQASALEVRFQPGDHIYFYDNAGEGTPRDLYTVVVQNVAFVNTTDAPLTLESARIEAVRDGQVVQHRSIDTDAMGAAAQQFNAYQEHGVLAAYDFQFQTSRYLEGAGFPASTTLEPGDALVLQRQALLLIGLADAVRVVVDARDASGQAVSASGDLKLLDHQSPNTYTFPVKGRWIAAAAPSLHSHHRWASVQEFALDLVQIGDDTRTHEGDGTRLEQFYAYGEPIYAIGAGTVVDVENAQPESNDNLRQPDETEEAYFERMMAEQQKLLAQGLATVFGNRVIIEHPGGEFSAYLHLATGSVTVKIGDRVTKGQQIGRLGHSGNSTEPHLHFHVTDGPDMAYSRSLPVQFEDVKLWPSDDGTVRHLHSGQIVSVEPGASADD